MRTAPFQPARKMRHLVNSVPMGVLLVASLTACSAEIEADHPLRPDERVGRTIQPVIGGSPSIGRNEAVVALARFDAAGMRRGLCTATMIAPNLVLTARHCVSAVEGGAGCGPDGAAVVGAALTGDTAAANIGVFVSPDGAAPDTTSLASASALGKALVVDGSATTICNRDIALVILDRELEAPIAKVRFGPPTPKDVLTVVGFGVTESGLLTDVRRERSNVTWLGAGPKLYPESDRYGVGPAEVMIGESVCAGDSGGPLLAASGAVVGVASRVGNGLARDPNNLASTCVGDATHAVYSQIGAHEPLLARAFEMAGHRPWVEGKKNPHAKLGTQETASVTRANDPSSLIAEGDDTETKALAGAAVDAKEDAAEAGSGCTISPAPGGSRDAVAEALGVTAVLLLLFRAGRRSRREASHRDA